MEKEPTLISIVICTYNREKYIWQALDSVRNQSVSSDRYEVIVIDNNSTDKSNEIIRKFIADNPGKPFSLFEEKRQGLSYARNRGIEEARGQIIVFIDDDAIARHDFIENLTKFFAQYPEAAAMGGKVIPKFTEGEPQWLSPFVRKVVSEIDFGPRIKELKGRKYPFGANMSFRAEVFSREGEFNTGLGRSGQNLLGGEEKDIFERMKKAGLKIFYSPDVVVQHIIDPYRLTPEYIERFCKGVGVSERIRLRKGGRAAKMLKLAENKIKRLASIFIGHGYVLAGERAKGNMIKDVMRWIEEGYESKESSQ